MIVVQFNNKRYQLLVFQIVYNSTESPEIQLTSDMLVFDSTQEATLQCTAVGGYPPIHNISLIKNGQVILNKVSDEVIFTTSGGLPRNVYGLYDCIVNNTVGTSSKTILLQHKGT